MQDPLSILFCFIPLIMVIASNGDSDGLNKEWSRPLDLERSTVNGIGSWNTRFMSQDKQPSNVWNRSKNRVRSPNTLSDADSINDAQFSVSSSLKLDDRTRTFTITQKIDDSVHEKDRHLNETTYTNWLGGNDKHGAYSTSNYTQPKWQLPVLNLNSSHGQKENLTVLPLSVMHKIWENTSHLKRNGDFDDDASDFENEVEDEPKDHQGICRGECLKEKHWAKGDVAAAETQVYQGRGGMNGGQQILLIKDKGENGGEAAASTMNGKEGVAPLIMMLTPLIMMCLMMPMMMSIMAGMMNFMRSMTTTMVMLGLPQNGISPLQQGLLPKIRKSDDESTKRANHFLDSFLPELIEKFEEALRKYDL